MRRHRSAVTQVQKTNQDSLGHPNTIKRSDAGTARRSEQVDQQHTMTKEGSPGLAGDND